MSRLVLPPGHREPVEPAPEAPPGLTLGEAIEALDADATESLEGLPPSSDTMAATTTRIARTTYGVLTMSLPPTMHPEYEVVTAWERVGSGRWQFKDRWIRAPGEAGPLARLDEKYRVVKEA